MKVTILILSLILFYFGNRLGYIFLNAQDLDPIPRVTYTINEIFPSFFEQPFFFCLEQSSIMLGLIALIATWLVYFYKAFDNSVYRQGEEHGSAKFGEKNDIKPFMEVKKKDEEQNIILSATEGLSLNTRKTLRNNNILVVGGSGSGKTRFFLKPNLMQAHSNYVITDPKGTILPECGKMLSQNGYKIKVFNTIDFSKSMHYNPFHYIKSEKDILKFVNVLILNTSAKDEKQDFWVKAEKLLYQSLIAYIHSECKEKNFATLIDYLDQMKASEEDEDFESPIDIMFAELEEKKGDTFAVRQYKKYKQASGKTAKSILISASARLAPFDIDVLREITSFDEMDFEAIPSEKTALFIIIDDTDSTYNFIVSILYSQLFNTLCNLADNVYKGRLPIHCRFLLDEFANIGQIPEFEKLIATVRSREISMNVIIQNMAQLKGLYKEQAGTIVGNCDTMLFLGSGEEETTKSISTKVGKGTISHKQYNETKGQNGSVSINNSIIARDLLTPDEVGLLKTDECLTFLRGVRPFKSKKYDIKKHKRYRLLSDFDDGNYFDIQEYLQFKPMDLIEKINDGEIDVYDIELSFEEDEFNINDF